MHITFRSTLLASSMLLACTLNAGVVDGINQNDLPAFGGEVEEGLYTAITWSHNEVYFQYVPSFDYELTGLFTRFSNVGTLPHMITLGIYDYNPLGVLPASGPLRSFSFALTPGSVDIVPGPGELLTGTDWLGNNTFTSLQLNAGTAYYIGLSGLVILNTQGQQLSSAGVNTVHNPDSISSAALLSQTFSTTPILTFAGSLDNSYYTDPIFKFEASTPVPEPSTYGLFGAVGLLSFAAYRRRFGRKS